MAVLTGTLPLMTLAFGSDKPSGSGRVFLFAAFNMIYWIIFIRARFSQGSHWLGDSKIKITQILRGI